MFTEFHYWNIEKIIGQFINENNLNTLGFEVKWAVGKNYIARGIMAYRADEKTIFFNPDRINQLYRKFPFFTPTEFILLTFIHEIGHHMHWCKEKEQLEKLKQQERDEKRRIPEHRYIFEMGAWEYGKQFVPAGLEEKFDLLNEINMETYVEEKKCLSLKKQLEYYTSLTPEKELKLSKGNIGKVFSWKKSGSVDQKKADVIEDMLNKLNDEKVIKSYINDSIITVVKNNDEIRLIVQSLYTFNEITTYKFTKPAC